MCIIMEGTYIEGTEISLVFSVVLLGQLIKNNPRLDWPGKRWRKSWQQNVPLMGLVYIANIHNPIAKHRPRETLLCGSVCIHSVHK